MQKNWILIRGLVRSVGHWADVPQVLQQAFPNDQFEFLDIPGNGYMHQVASPLKISQMVEDIRGRSQFIKAGKKVHIMAVSLGGMVAAAWADKYPSEVEQLVLVNSSSAKHSKIYERLRPDNYLTITGLAFDLALTKKPDYEHVEREILKMNLNSSERRQAVLPIWAKESETRPIHLKNFFRQLVAASTFKFPAKPAVPTVVFASDNDRFVNVSCSKKLAASWQCPIHLHPWAGHDLPVDDPQWIVEKLKVI